jgi:hypothetical protein
LDLGQPLGQALTLLGRFHLLRGEIEDALHLLDQAIEEVEARSMTAFLPWPESFRGELDLVLGDVASAEARFEHAFSLGCQVGDPCWESTRLMSRWTLKGRTRRRVSIHVPSARLQAIP